MQNFCAEQHWNIPKVGEYSTGRMISSWFLVDKEKEPRIANTERKKLIDTGGSRFKITNMICPFCVTINAADLCWRNCIKNVEEN